MARLRFYQVGKYGLVTDVPPHQLPPEAWSGVQNMKMQDNCVVRTFGERNVGGTLSHAPFCVFPSPSATTAFWVYAGLGKVTAITPGTSPVHTDITRASGGDYTGTLANRWNGGWLNGILVLNNGVDVPQFWGPINTSTKLVALTNWQTNTLAKVIRPYKNFLIALDITKNSHLGANADRYPTMVKWSHPADPGQVPSSWNEADPAKLTGENSLSQTPGFLIDCLALRDANIVYKQDAIILQQFVGGQDIFSWREISAGTGIMSQQCAVEFKPGFHAVFTMEGDLVVNNGQTIEGVIDKKVLRYIEQNISFANRDYSFLVADQRRKEVWICFPTGNNAFATQALIWNWKDNSIGHRALTATYDIKRGIYDPNVTQLTWAGLGGTWDSPSPEFSWAQDQYSAYEQHLIGACYGASELHMMNVDQTLDGTEYESSVERKGLSLIGQDPNGGWVVDYQKNKLITEVWPIVEAPVGTTINVYVGAQDEYDEQVTWQGPLPFVTGQQVKVDCLVEGKFIAIKFASTAQVEWKLHGYGLELNVVGEYF